MISYDEACSLIIKESLKINLKTSLVSVEDAINRVCADNIISPIKVQPFDNSAMDGFAIRCADLKPPFPITLTSIQTIAAGNEIVHSLKKNHCTAIMTGAPVPAGADAVVPIEQVKIQKDGSIVFFEQPKLGANIRFSGEDFKKGDLLLSKGDKVNIAHILPLIATGTAKIPVFNKPKTAFIATGKELINNTSKKLKKSQIYNTNLPYGKYFLKNLGTNFIGGYTVYDESSVFVNLLKKLMDKKVDIIISSGAVSEGKFDFIKNSLKSLKTHIYFHKIKIKPGKPVLFGKLPNGSLFFGLPGNPAASAVGLYFFVKLALDTMLKTSKISFVKGRLTNGLTKKNDFQFFLKANMKVNSNGYIDVTLLDGQESFKVKPFLKMNCWVVFPPNVTVLKKTQLVDVYPTSFN